MWLFAFSTAIIPILWVSVSYITLILKRIQDIKPPDIEEKIALISGDNTGSCESGATLTESISQALLPAPVNNGKHPSILTSDPHAPQRKMTVKKKSGCGNHSTTAITEIVRQNSILLNCLLTHALSSTS